MSIGMARYKSLYEKSGSSSENSENVSYSESPSEIEKELLASESGDESGFERSKDGQGD